MIIQVKPRRRNTTGRSRGLDRGVKNLRGGGEALRRGGSKPTPVAKPVKNKKRRKRKPRHTPVVSVLGSGPRAGTAFTELDESYLWWMIRTQHASCDLRAARRELRRRSRRQRAGRQPPHDTAVSCCRLAANESPV